MKEFPDPARHANEIHRNILLILDQKWKCSDEQPDGASGKDLMEMLGIDNILEVESALHWLRDRGLIEIGLRQFLISEKGRQYLDGNRS